MDICFARRPASAGMLKRGLLASVALAGVVLVCGFCRDSSGQDAGERGQAVNATSPRASPLYRSSVVGTDFDFITDDDIDAFGRLEYVGYKPFEMPDKRNTGEPLSQDAYVFNLYFTDGTRIGVALDKEFGSLQAAEQDIVRYTSRLGKLPSLYRQNIRHVVVHKGGADTTSFAEDKGHFFVIYSDNATKRIGTHDLEETFFHEATHASIQTAYLSGEDWKGAKARDNAVVTEYANESAQEDFAESALFAYTIIRHPERLPTAERERIQKQIPNRIAFFRRVYAQR